MYDRRVELYVVQNSWAGHRINGIAVNSIMDIWPEPNYPHGRKALAMSGIWRSARAAGEPGILWVDPDIAADPDDLAAMEAAVVELPEDMHTAAVKLWPESTGLDHWIWSHRGGTLGFPVATQQETAPVSYVAQGFLWTPARLLDLVFPRHENAQWAEVDVLLSEYALVSGITAHLVAGCRPKHLHFDRSHDGNVIYQRSNQTAPLPQLSPVHGAHCGRCDQPSSGPA